MFTPKQYARDKQISSISLSHSLTLLLMVMIVLHESLDAFHLHQTIVTTAIAFDKSEISSNFHMFWYLITIFLFLLSNVCFIQLAYIYFFLALYMEWSKKLVNNTHKLYGWHFNNFICQCLWYARTHRLIYVNSIRMFWNMCQFPFTSQLLA